MEVEEEDCSSSEDNFSFPDNCTNPETTEALHAETIRQDPVPSTSRIMVDPMSSRNFRINKMTERKLRLCSGSKPRRRKAIRGIGQQAATSAGRPDTWSGTARGPSSGRCPAPSAAAVSWRAREMTTIDEEAAAVGHTKFHAKSSAPSETKRRMAKYEMMRQESSGASQSRHLDRILAALRVNVQRMKAMSMDNPEALRESLPDETIAMMRKFHI